MAYICTPHEVAGLRGMRQKSLCRLYPSWLNESGGISSEDWEFDADETKRHYSTIDDIENGNYLDNGYVRPLFHLSSNCSLPLTAGPNARAIRLQHAAQLGFTHAAIVIGYWTSDNSSIYFESITFRLGFWPYLFDDMQVLRRDKPWLKVVGEYKIIRFKQSFTVQCTNVDLVGTLDENNNTIGPVYSPVQVAVIMDEQLTVQMTMTSKDEVFNVETFSTEPPVYNYSTYTDQYGNTHTFLVSSYEESGYLSYDEITIYGNPL